MPDLASPLVASAWPLAASALPAAFGPVARRLTTLQPGLAFGVGLVLVGFGARLWRFVAVGSGLAIGGWCGWTLGAALGTPALSWVAAIALALGVAWLFNLVERMAIAGMGGAVAVELCRWVWPLVERGQPANAVLVGAAVIGMVTMALLHQRAIRALTALAGGALVAWGLGYAGNPWIIGGLGVLGAWYQGRGGAPRGGEKKRRREEE